MTFAKAILFRFKFVFINNEVIQVRKCRRNLNIISKRRIRKVLPRITAIVKLGILGINVLISSGLFSPVPLIRRYVPYRSRYVPKWYVSMSHALDGHCTASTIEATLDAFID